MIGKILMLLLMGCPAVFANLSAGELRERLEIRADVYILDADGRKILSGPERTVAWRMNPEKGELKGDWSSGFDKGLIALRHDWKLMDDGTLKVTIEEYGQAVERDRGGPDFKNLLERKEIIVENLEPVVWKVKNIKDHHFVVRYIPFLREVRKPISVESLPVAGTEISITDNTGYLWADGVGFSGKYSGLTTHRGTLVLSYVPFQGAKEAGYADGNEIRLKFGDKFQVNLKSSTSFLPAGVMAKVFAAYRPDRKSKGFNSVHTFDTNKEERILKALQ